MISSRGSVRSCWSNNRSRFHILVDDGPERGVLPKDKGAVLFNGSDLLPCFGKKRVGARLRGEEDGRRLRERVLFQERASLCGLCINGCFRLDRQSEGVFKNRFVDRWIVTVWTA